MVDKNLLCLRSYENLEICIADAKWLLWAMAPDAKKISKNNAAIEHQVKYTRSIMVLLVDIWDF